jgi:hypothetical protein
MLVKAFISGKGYSPVMRRKESRTSQIGRREAIGAIGATGASLVLGRARPPAAERSAMQVTNPVPSGDVLRYGAYVCLRVPEDARPAAASAEVPSLAESLRLQNEFDSGEGHPSDAIAFLRRVDAEPRDIVDDDLLLADAVIHVASRSAATVAEFCAGALRLLGAAAEAVVLEGVVRPPSYTGAAMHDFAYARQVLQQPGHAMPNGFLIPMKKTAAWWAKGWMERHTYFLPRYDEAGRMVSEGHALAAAAGIPCLMRRTYRSLAEPAPDGAYDFINYFECADRDVPTFHRVCAALRDVARNPEWRFVQEGPTWRGRRVRTWAELFS